MNNAVTPGNADPIAIPFGCFHRDILRTVSIFVWTGQFYAIKVQGNSSVVLLLNTGMFYIPKPS
jgi:hypothetical protein